MASIEERVINIVADQLGVEKEKITRDSNFVNDLGADSLDTVELVMELEEELRKNQDIWSLYNKLKTGEKSRVRKDYYNFDKLRKLAEKFI